MKQLPYCSKLVRFSITFTNVLHFCINQTTSDICNKTNSRYISVHVFILLVLVKSFGGGIGDR